MEETKEKITNKAARFRLYYRIFLFIGILGLVDIATRSSVKQQYGLNGIGYIGMVFLYLFSALFGSEIGATIAIIIKAILSFPLSWLVLAYFMDVAYAYFMEQKSKVEEQPNDMVLQEEDEIAKIIVWIFEIVVLIMFLLGILAGIGYFFQ